MKAAIILLLIAFACPVRILAQRLPEGKLNRVRERAYDVLHFKASLEFEFAKGRVFGEATVTLTPLRKLDSLSLDAIALNVRSVSLRSKSNVKFRTTGKALNIRLPSRAEVGETLAVTIAYDATPRAGLYFRKDPSTEKYFVDTYGEGGLHANWLPIYNDVNDKFTSEMLVTVPPPYTVISNSKLVETIMKGEGFTTYHWLQSLPHSNYLIALYVGDYEEGKLAPAFGSIALSAYTPRGRLSEGLYAFRNAPKMVEFFSNRFGYRYPWSAYDLIATPDYTIGAMEHTGISGHRDCVLRDATAPLDFGPPTFDEYYSDWSAEATISHELSHHWFGDNTTCASLGYIWLNESFASYAMMLWDEESVGRDQFLFDLDLAKRHYVNYVHKENIIRPLEYHRFDNADVIYNEQHTYLKGACVLHMLRRILGDEQFFRSLSLFLRKHEFKNVVSDDFRVAVAEATGRDLSWFFKEWVTGAGHPQFEVSYTYVPTAGAIDLSVKQVQPRVEGQGVFTIPATVTIATPHRTRTDTIQIKTDDEHFVIPSDERPLMVSFDGEGSLVAEIRFDKEVEELAYQATHDELPGRLWAMRQMSDRHPTSKATLSILAKIIDEPRSWADASEAAQLLGAVRSGAALTVAKQALASNEYRVRKAAVLGLTQFGSAAAGILRETILRDSHSDVVGAAIVALARVERNTDINFIAQQLTRPSWYNEIVIACLNAFRETKNPAALAYLKKYTGSVYKQYVREAAFIAWSAIAPDDSALHRILIDAARNSPLRLQQKAIELLGNLYVREAEPTLSEIQRLDFDANLTVGAKEALGKIARMRGGSDHRR
ncbi:MAG: HEAT repeat domain-containing protein [Ignavibacteriae bacterium]|nr:HEAT repeat domain-containing protein [Ignavibacteriota bacterium]